MGTVLDTSAGSKVSDSPPDVHKDSMYMVNMIKELGITTIHFVPSMLNVFMQCDMSKCNSLKELFAVVKNYQLRLLINSMIILKRVRFYIIYTDQRKRL